MPRLPHTDERTALRLEDIASQIDAGIPAEQILPSAASLLKGFVPALESSSLGTDLNLSAAERASLVASETAGTLPRAMRRLAQTRRMRAEITRDIAGRLIRPVATLAVGLLAASIAAPLMGMSRSTIWLALAGLVTACTVFAFWLRRKTQQDPGFSGRVLGLAPLLQDCGESEYLWSMYDLYDAGVPIHQAHELALRSCSIAHVRGRLFVANGVLQRNDPYGNALGTSNALTDESTGMLRTAEKAGDLTGAFERLAKRRSESYQRRLARTIAIVTSILYSLVVIGVAWFVLNFYGGLFSSYGRITSR